MGASQKRGQIGSSEEKLKTIGASSQVVNWFASYLESRYQVSLYTDVVYLFENIGETASEVSARERAHYPFALAINKSPAVYILSPSPRSTDFEEKIEGL